MMSPRMIRRFALVGLIAAASLSTHSDLRAGGPPSGSLKVVAPDKTFRGLTYGEWSVEWWQWALSLPTDAHPLFDTAPASEGQVGNVWFLGVKFDGNWRGSFGAIRRDRRWIPSLGRFPSRRTPRRILPVPEPR